MPEGPSIVLLKEAVQDFKGKKIISAYGNTKAFDLIILEGKKIVDFKSWGKHFLICFSKFTIRIHFLLFGSFSVNEERNKPVRLGLNFKNGFINFFSCSVKIMEENPDDVYDWTSDVMSDSWNAQKAKSKLMKLSGTPACDALLNQEIFAGVGNIIKNEVLFRIRLHPLSQIHKIPSYKLKKLIAEARHYSFDFLRWKKVYELKKHYLIYNKKICPRCNIPVTRRHLGKFKRRSFYCEKCQKLYI